MGKKFTADSFVKSGGVGANALLDDGNTIALSGTNTGDQDLSGLQPLLTNPITGTGTTNYIAKFNGTTSETTSTIFDNGSNIGIGATSSFFGDIYIVRPSKVGVAAVNGGSTAINSKGNISLFSNDTFAINKGGTLAFGGKFITAGDYATFGIISGVKENNTDGSPNGAITFSTKSVTAGLYESARFTSDGYLLINATSVSGTSVIQANGTISATGGTSTNWNTAFSQTLQWNGGSTNLVAATGRTSLGGTTIGQSMFTLVNPSAITFPRFNADNTVSALTDSAFRTAIGAGTVTSVEALTIGTTGTNITSTVATGTTTPVITLNIPDASVTARGVVTTGSQSFAGAKTFTQQLAVAENTATAMTLTYGTFGVTRLATASNLSYVALTKTGTVIWGMGVSSTSDFIIGQPAVTTQVIGVPNLTISSGTGEATFSAGIKATGFHKQYIAQGSTATPAYETLATYGISSSNLSGIYGGNSFASDNGTYLKFRVNATATANTVIDALTILPTGAATFSSTVTATGFFNSSDKRLKNVLSRDGDLATFTWKDGRDDKKHIGYIAQEIQETYPDAVQEDNEGMLSVNYIEVLVAKIQALENRLKKLENGMV